ncbi:MAG: hypothetical protein D6705_08120 [Deltaproteobacteria bacterium]|nr:MAG: hypothetical protein D6705_08120 [Deltaproteobacteria bacterium]
MNLRNIFFGIACSSLVLGACVVESGDTGDTTSSTGSTSGTGSTTASTGQPTGGTTQGSGTATGTTGTADTGTGDTGTAGTAGTGGGADPNYPDPGPNVECPDGLIPVSFQMGYAVCAPACDNMGQCPDGESGTAMGACVFNPDSSGDACDGDADCTVPEETCQPVGGGGKACLLPSSHCALTCGGGETCPDGMECTDVGVCQYPAG